MIQKNIASLMVGIGMCLSLVTPSIAKTSVPNITVKTVSLGYQGWMFAQPALYGDTLIWAGNRNLNAIQQSDSLYSLNLDTHKRVLIAFTHYARQFIILCPQISKSWITWIDSGMNKKGIMESTIYAMNRKNHKIQVVSRFSDEVNGQLYLSWESLYGNDLVWNEPVKGEKSEVKFIDLASQKNHSVLSKFKTGASPSPYIYGSTVIWEQSTSLPDGSLIFYNLSKHSDSSLTIQGPFAYPKIYSKYVVYSPQSSNSHGLNIRNNIAVMKINTRKVIYIPARDAYFWDIGSGFVTWSDYSQISSHVYVASMNGGDVIDLGPGDLRGAYGKYVIWEQNHEVYLTHIL